MRAMFRCLVIAACVIAAEARAQCGPPAPPAVLDVNRVTSGSSVTGFTDLGDGRALFVVPGADRAAQLWITDGTEAGTTRLLTPLAGPSWISVKRAGSTNSAVLVAGSALASDIWVTDGTVAGTRNLLHHSPLGYRVHAWAVTDDAVYFTQSDIGWPAMQRMDLATGVSRGVYGGIVKAIAPFGSGVLLSGDDGVNGAELWFVDTSATMVADIAPGPEGSDPSDFTIVSGRAFFLATTATEGREPWVTDGTPAGTTLVSDIDPGVGSSDATSLVDAGGWLGFVASSPAGYAQPWRSDGTAAGTTLIAAVTVAVEGTSRVRRVAPWQGGLAYFVDEAGGRTLHVSDGFTDTPVAIVDAAFLRPDWQAGELAAIGSGVMFRASNPRTSSDPWFSDGTAAGTVRLADTLPDAMNQTVIPHGFTTFGALGLFVAQDRTAGDEPWITDGTPAGTRRLADIDLRSAASRARSFVSAPAPLFVADDGVTGSEVHVADLASATFTQVVDLAPGAASGAWSELMPVADAALFLGPGTTTGLWRTDGTGAGTLLVTDLPGYGFAVGAAAGRAYFALSGELWASDGTAAATASLGIPWSSYPRGSVMPFLSRGLLRTASEAWISDGTAGGTALLADVSPATITDATVWGDRIVFVVADGPDTALWMSRGAAGDAVPLDLLGTLPQRKVAEVEECGGYLFAVVQDVYGTGILAYTDGFTSLRQVPGSAAGRRPRSLATVGRHVMGLADAWPGGERVVLVDASGSAPTARLLDIGISADRVVPGAASWLALGRERTSGRRACRLVHADGSYRSVPLEPLADAEAAHVEGRFMVVADDGVVGAEPWIVEDDADGDGLVDPCDPCPALAASAGDLDGDLADEACDTCPGLADPLQADADHDGVGDACDACPMVGDAAGGDFDGDGLGNACDPDADADGILRDPASPLPDCNDLDPLAGTLREISDLRVGWDGSQVVLAWSDESAFAGPNVRYDVIGGPFTGLMDETQLIWSGDCIALRVPQATYSFPRTGDAWFLARTFVAGCAPGPIGGFGTPGLASAFEGVCP